MDTYNQLMTYAPHSSESLTTVTWPISNSPSDINRCSRAEFTNLFPSDSPKTLTQLPKIRPCLLFFQLPDLAIVWGAFICGIEHRHQATSRHLSTSPFLRRASEAPFPLPHFSQNKPFVSPALGFRRFLLLWKQVLPVSAGLAWQIHSTNSFIFVSLILMQLRPHISTRSTYHQSESRQHRIPATSD